MSSPSSAATSSSPDDDVLSWRRCDNKDIEKRDSRFKFLNFNSTKSDRRNAKKAGRSCLDLNWRDTGSQKLTKSLSRTLPEDEPKKAISLSLKSEKQKSLLDHRNTKEYTVYTSMTSSEKSHVAPDSSISTWTRIVSMKSSDILFTLVSGRYGFFQLLDQVGDSRYPGLIPLLLTALGKAVASPHKTNVNHLVNKVQSNKIFMFCTLPSFLANLDHSNLDDTRVESLSKLLEFVDCYQRCMPASSCQSVSILLPHLKLACQKVSQFSLATGGYSSVLTERINDIEKHKKEHVHNKSEKEMETETRMESLHLQKPPDNFHDIPIFPRYKDIWQKETFLRPNLTKGKYSGVDDYLDVQFRLLREDYIRPLRESIVEYSRTRKDRVDFRKLKVYENVSIVDFEVVFGGIQHTAFFDAKPFKKVNWEHSKRFLTGSLLCLTTDGFQTMLFATVTTRKPQDLQKGILKLKFEELTTEILQIKPIQKYTVIETEAFFEAYRHNLAAFQCLTEDNFPLKRYIVEMATDITPPPYSISGELYDVGPLLVPLETSKAELASQEKCIDIHKEEEWPTEMECGMDRSQFEALRAALTKQFVVIQGPPGTGKTFVGLRITEIILRNSRYLSTSRFHILIVCYTNHALDQFLEGMLRFTKSIVRIGGRSSSKALEEFNLTTKKQKMKNDRVVPNNLHKSLQSQRDYLSGLQKDLELMQRIIEESSRCVRWNQSLAEGMPELHRTSLLFCNPEQDYGIAISSALFDWLEIATEIILREELENHAMNSQESISHDAETESNTSDDEEFEELFDIEAFEETRINDSQEWESFIITPGKIQVTDNGEDPTKKSIEDDWKVQGGQKAENKHIADKLANTTSMSHKEAMRVRNVWSLNTNNRWRLYKHWMDQYVVLLQCRLLQLEQNFQNEIQNFQEMQADVDLLILRESKIIGMTTTGAAKYRKIVQELSPKVVIVEEAAEILESHVVTALAKETEHLILIGDHQQLRPNPTVYELDMKYNLGISLFERMINNGMEYYKLSIQHRMRPCIASLLVPHIYTNLLNHESVLKFEDIRGMQKNVFFVTHKFPESSVFDSSSRENQHEAQFMVRLCEYLLNQGYEPSQITILTTYTGQFFKLKSMAKDRLQNVRITLVDNYQGEENDIILVSFVRSNEEGNIGFLKISNRVCVALSRAKKGLYCIGNFEQMAKQSKLWSDIVDKLKKSEIIGSSMRFICQNHVDTITDVTLPKDFMKVPRGGCQRKCEYRLQCGHSCITKCHPYDLSHEDVRCVKKCSKILCKQGHNCPLTCSEECPTDCKVFVERQLPTCGHIVLMHCYMHPEKYTCPHACERLLTCGHKCEKICGMNCNEFKCRNTVKTQLQCGHEGTLECCLFQKILSTSEKETSSHAGNHKDDEYSIGKSIANFMEKNHDSDISGISDYVCPKPCATVLYCGHVCHGTCGECKRGADHVPCTKPCVEILLCGHSCPSICGLDCLMSKCEVPVLVSLSCGHELTRPCYQCLADDSCTESCKVLLQCGHPCKAKCGKCQKKCLHEKHKDQLPPCNEIVSKVLPSCGHREEMPCHVQTSDFSCTKPCERKLNCGHSCGLKCGKECSESLCEEIVPVRIKCGHEMQMKCYTSSVAGNFFGFCDKPCRMKMACGHICTSTCTACQQGRLHKVCQMKCSRKLLCGHECEDNCSRSCPPCNKTCERSCIHSKCTHKCGIVCSLCTEPCQWSCDHQKCTNLCGEPCNREPCTESCPKLLGCSHPCLGLCGDPCPNLCNICKPEKINQMQFLNSKIVEGAKFIQLMDCNHIFEANSITLHVVSLSQNNDLSMASCPTCHIPIKTTQRFGNFTKAFWSNVGKAKKKILEIQKDTSKNRDALVEQFDKVNSKDMDNCVLPLTNAIEEDGNLIQEQITKLQNIVNLAEEFIEVFPSFYFQYIFKYYFAFGKDCILPPTVVENARRLKHECRLSWNMVNSFLRYDSMECSEQQVQELSWEVQRFKYQCSLLDLFFKQQYRMKVDKTLEDSFGRIVDVLCSIGRFRSLEEGLMKLYLKEFDKALNISLKIAEVKPKKIMLTMISFARNRWFCGRNGQVYFCD